MKTIFFLFGSKNPTLINIINSQESTKDVNLNKIFKIIMKEPFLNNINPQLCKNTEQDPLVGVLYNLLVYGFIFIHTISITSSFKISLNAKTDKDQQFIKLEKYLKKFNKYIKYNSLIYILYHKSYNKKRIELINNDTLKDKILNIIPHSEILNFSRFFNQIQFEFNSETQGSNEKGFCLDPDYFVYLILDIFMIILTVFFIFEDIQANSNSENSISIKKDDPCVGNLRKNFELFFEHMQDSKNNSLFFKDMQNVLNFNFDIKEKNIFEILGSFFRIKNNKQEDRIFFSNIIRGDSSVEKNLYFLNLKTNKHIHFKIITFISVVLVMSLTFLGLRRFIFKDKNMNTNNNSNSNQNTGKNQSKNDNNNSINFNPNIYVNAPEPKYFAPALNTINNNKVKNKI
jgi:hypothetical protein